jgi:long-chain fatty acid transport protein
MLTIGLAFETTSFFQDFAYNTPQGVDKLTFNQPCVLTGGVAVRPIEMLLVAADVEWINWPATNGADKPAYEQNASGAIPWNMNWSSQVVFKLGVQVTPLDWLALRAGYNYGKMPLDASRAFENIAFPAVAENHVTIGAGFTLGKHVTINVGGMWAPSTSLTGSNADFPQGTPGYPGPYGQGIATYTTSMTQVGIDGGIAYRF